MTRILTPELLDSLPSQHPDALHSRRDLRWINHAMGNHRWFAATLPPMLRNGERVLELGAGTGTLAARLAARGVVVDGLDFCPRPAAWPSERAWHTGDLRDFAGYHEYTGVYGNLIFHHLSDAELTALGATLRKSVRVILASEPVRSARAQRLFAVCGRVCGANHVTLHDAHVSIAAGFRGHELPRLLGLDPNAWSIRVGTTWLGAYRMVAFRHA
jgi:2-polyprenyl-3-methyl-5-hydroxy-6-metoxy-1,4-benzoquinol methylase